MTLCPSCNPVPPLMTSHHCQQRSLSNAWPGLPALLTHPKFPLSHLQALHTVGTQPVLTQPMTVFKTATPPSGSHDSTAYTGQTAPKPQGREAFSPRLSPRQTDRQLPLALRGKQPAVSDGCVRQLREGRHSVTI